MYEDLCACQACNRKRQQGPHDQSQRHRCSRDSSQCSTSTSGDWSAAVADCLWTRKHLRWIPVHDLCLSLEPEKSRGILFVHAFTGCDVVSSFRGKGKKSAWQTWNVCDEASDVFSKLNQYPPAVDDEDLETLENFVVMMYDRSSTAEGVDDARLDMLEAVRSHSSYSRRSTAACEACCLPGRLYMESVNSICQPETQSPADWGWTKKGDLWQIFWTELLPIAESCEQLTKCGCKSECRGRCKCYTALVLPALHCAAADAKIRS